MLREVPGLSSPTREMASQPVTTSELHDDIFGSAPNSPVLGSQETSNDNVPAAQIVSSTNSERSDIPRLRSVHVTNGYRDGISVSKAEHVQNGFDEGFSLGAVLGLKAGFLLGVLEGGVRAVSSSPAVPKEIKERVIALFINAREELGLRSLFSPNYFGEDGIWRYEVPGADEEVTFRVVADEHPLIKKWTEEVENLKQVFGLTFHANARPDEEDEKDLNA